MTSRLRGGSFDSAASATLLHYNFVVGVRSTQQPASNGAAGPASQIPGLSQTANITPEERTKGRRVGVQASDSDYVKLAKQGGQKGKCVTPV